MSYKPKIVLAGQSGVGKSSIVSRFIRDEDPNTSPTVGCALFRKRVKTDDAIIDLDIWDTAGQERFRSMSGFYFRQCHYCILVFALDDEESFQMVDTWRKICNEATPIPKPKPIYFLVGNKLDVDERKVSEADIKRYCRYRDIVHYAETSASTGEGIYQLLEALVKHMSTRLEAFPAELPTITLREEPPSECPC